MWDFFLSRCHEVIQAGHICPQPHHFLSLSHTVLSYPLSPPGSVNSSGRSSFPVVSPWCHFQSGFNFIQSSWCYCTTNERNSVYGITHLRRSPPEVKDSATTELWKFEHIWKLCSHKKFEHNMEISNRIENYSLFSLTF